MLSKNNISSIIGNICFFLFCFSFKPFFFPLSFKIFFAIIGVVIFVVDIVFFQKKLSRYMYALIGLYIFFIIITGLATAINNTGIVGPLIFYVYQYFVVFFAAYFVATFLQFRTIDEIIELYITCYSIQCLIILFSFFISDFGNLIFSLQDYGNNTARFKTLSDLRAFGLGFGFDGGAMQLSISLLFILYRYFNSYGKQSIKYVLLFYFQLLTGMLVARTIFVGCFFCMVFFLIYRGKNIEKKIFFIFYFIIFCILVIFLCFFLLENYGFLIRWIFEFFIEKSTTSESSFDILFGKMYFSVKENTLLIGDGMLDMPDGSYYMGTDGGYMRTILLCGIPGIICYLMIELTYFRGLKRRFSEKAKLWSVILFADLVFFIKIIVFPISPFSLICILLRDKKAISEK